MVILISPIHLLVKRE